MKVNVIWATESQIPFMALGPVAERDLKYLSIYS
jgi:hypothetical protein